MNAALSAVQQRNLQAAWSVPVVDRSGLIIDIFAQRALSKEASLQVSACWPLAPTSSSQGWQPFSPCFVLMKVPAGMCDLGQHNAFSSAPPPAFAEA